MLLLKICLEFHFFSKDACCKTVFTERKSFSIYGETNLLQSTTHDSKKKKTTEAIKNATKSSFRSFQRKPKYIDHWCMKKEVGLNQSKNFVIATQRDRDQEFFDNFFQPNKAIFHTPNCGGEINANVK